ncbi:unnamed protein product, partial [Iphiclides podalirius]
MPVDGLDFVGNKKPSLACETAVKTQRDLTGYSSKQLKNGSRCSGGIEATEGGTFYGAYFLYIATNTVRPITVAIVATVTRGEAVTHTHPALTTVLRGIKTQDKPASLLSSATSRLHCATYDAFPVQMLNTS